MQALFIESNLELLLTQIFCIRLNLGRGIVRLRVGLPYDRLRFCPRFFDLFSSFSFNLLPGLYLITSYSSKSKSIFSNQIQIRSLDLDLLIQDGIQL